MSGSFFFEFETLVSSNYAGIEDILTISVRPL